MTTPSTTDVRVLVVDDLATNVRLLEAVLRPRGFDVVGAGSGPEALAILGRGDIDIVLLDVNMPGMDGLEVCRMIRANPSTALLPVVMVTAAAEEERIGALEAGADDFLRQPVEQAELLARVRSLARLKRYHDALEGQAAELSAWNEVLETSVQEQLAELERLRLLRRFLSAPVAEALVETGDLSLLEPHRREIAVVACEMRSVTVSPWDDPGAGLRAVRAYHEVLGGIVQSHGATVGPSHGDSLLAWFGDPTPDADPVLPALVLATSLRDAVGALRSEAEGEGSGDGAAITVAMSICTGEATLGQIGFDGRLDYGAVGPVVTRARRLCERAGDGEILLDEPSISATRGRADVGDLQSVTVRGGIEPLTSGALVRVHLAHGDRRTTPVVSPVGQRRVERGIEVNVLGPTEVRAAGAIVPITASKERGLLALLVANRGRTVSIDNLAEHLWAGSPPESAVATLRVHVSRLRKTLAQQGLDGLLVTKPSGYELDVPPDAVDIDRFEGGLTTARRAVAEGRPNEGVLTMRSALSLWRGAAFSELTSSSANAEAIRLEELRLVAMEECLAAELACGRHREVIGELEAWVHDHPLRERFWELLMLALYRSGRQPDALRAFQALRARLGEELGLEPSPQLVHLDRAIVAHDPTLRWTGDVVATL
jgi:DNA-binding response OmpR family regulator